MSLRRTCAAFQQQQPANQLAMEENQDMRVDVANLRYLLGQKDIGLFVVDWPRLVLVIVLPVKTHTLRTFSNKAISLLAISVQASF